LSRRFDAPRDSSELERGAALFFRSFVLLLAGYVCMHRIFPFERLDMPVGQMTGADFLLFIFRTLFAIAAALYFTMKAFAHPHLRERDRNFCERWAVLGLGTITISACSIIAPHLKGDGPLQIAARILARGILWLLI
jgi:hypothetical protein